MKPVLEALLDSTQPTPEAARSSMDAVMRGEVDEVVLAAVLTAFHHVPPTAATLAAFARAIRGHMVRVEAEGPLVDTCGTGGSGLDTANTSTLAAFVVAACGGRVAKHGNRSSSGKCGSSDLLEAVGVRVAVGPDEAARLLDEVGLAFLFAPAYHPSFRHVGAVRRRLGFRTVFNLLGPLCNPAGAGRQLLGVSDPALAPLLAETLGVLGSDRVLVVHGEDGLDELSLAARTRTWRLSGGRVVEGTVDAVDLGLLRSPPESFRGGDVPTNVAIFHRVLGGEPGPHTDLVVLNAAAALEVAGVADTLSDGLRLAREAVASGAARERFEAYRAAAGVSA
ncbi:MAG: anthranilate phosphoribosyltransferase [Alphaproteobacteria bacterium]|nr:anthranilate phosphoribosyltransferase [Alphaproteobacteria bacterium]